MKTTIALVDDDDGIRDAAELLMRSYGWEVWNYPSEEAFLADFATVDAPDCIVLDLHLSGMSGANVTERLSHDGANVPVIIPTAEPDHPLATRAVEGGVIMVLAKPFPGERLIEVIQTVIRAQRELFKLEHLSGVMLFLGSRQSSSS